jgi:uncharacterized protein YjbJ (UPF0337 family)
MKMDRDTAKGKAKEGLGSVKKAWGDATDDERTAAEGRVEQFEGKAQQGVGRAKEELHDLSSDDSEGRDG